VSLVKQLATQPKKTLFANPEMQKTNALLPDRLQAVLYLSLRGFVDMRLAGTATPLPDSPPIAFALRTLPAGAEAQFLIPFDTLRAVFETFNPKEKK
jgi:hypothetical protein